MFRNSSAKFIVPLIFLFLATFLALPAVAQQSCFTPEARKQAEQTARVFREPDPGYNPVLGYNPPKVPPRRPASRSQRARKADQLRRGDKDEEGHRHHPEVLLHCPGQRRREWRPDPLQSETPLQGAVAGQA